MSKRNILFLMLDQLRADAIQAYGNSIIDTPNIERLRKMGVTFDQAYVQGASCGNSRASYYTGRHCRSHGATWNDWPLRVDELTLADHLKTCDMETLLLGKTHMKPAKDSMQRLGIEPDSDLGRFVGNAGFHQGTRDDGLHTVGPSGYYDTSVSPYNNWLKEQGFEGENPWLQWANAGVDKDGKLHHGMYLDSADKPSRIDKEFTETAYMTDRALEAIDHMGDKNWCIHLSYIKPHWPLIAAAPYHDLYRGADFAAPNRCESELENPHPVYQAYTQLPPAKGWRDIEQRNKSMATYYGLIKELDDHIGRILNHLEASGAIKETLIVFCSDHGDYFGDHWMGEKDLFHKEAIQVPLIIVDPDGSADSMRGQRVSQPVRSIDLIPTMVEWCGKEPMWNWLEGQSLLPLLHDSQAQLEEQLIVCENDYSRLPFAKALGRNPYNARNTMAYDGRYKFIHMLGFAPMLYDLQEDPQERRDLGRDPAYAPIREQMLERLFDWSAELKNRAATSQELYEEKMGRSIRCGISPGFANAQEIPDPFRVPERFGLN